MGKIWYTAHSKEATKNRIWEERSWRILAVDDEPLILKGLRFSLEQDGYIVEEALDGQSALDMIQSTQYDLILLDVMLPDIDGLQVCTRLKRDPDTAGIPVIMLTARGDEIDKVLGLEMGADDYVVKPFSPKELMLRIQAVLKRCAPPEVAKKKEVYSGAGSACQGAAAQIRFA